MHAWVCVTYLPQSQCKCVWPSLESSPLYTDTLHHRSLRYYWSEGGGQTYLWLSEIQTARRLFWAKTLWVLDWRGEEKGGRSLAGERRMWMDKEEGRERRKRNVRCWMKVRGSGNEKKGVGREKKRHAGEKGKLYMKRRRRREAELAGDRKKIDNGMKSVGR